MKETVSVIIPNYNRAAILGETIENMLHQTLPPYEVIVVDDGSTDDSVKVIQSFGEKVRLIQQPNSGPGAARNKGFAASTGNFIQFMDSDDLASRNKFQVQVAALQNSDAGFAYCPWVRCHIKNHTISFADQLLQAEAVPSNKPMLEHFLSGWSLVFQNCLFKRSALTDAGAYRTDLMPSEDSEYFVRILLSGAKAVHTPGCIVFYRQDNNNKITTTGTTGEHRARDWTRYLQITGLELADELPKMQLSTRIALFSSVQSHLQHCAQLNLPQLPPDHPYLQLRFPFSKLLCEGNVVYQKLLRKLLQTPDFHPAFKRKVADATHRKLVSEIGYQNSNP